MRPALLLLVGCAGPTSDAGHTGAAENGLGIRLGLDEVPDRLLELTVRLGEVVFEGEGPSGEVSVTYDAGTEVALVGGAPDAAPVVLALEVGRWEEVSLGVLLAGSDAGPALAASGVVEGDRFEIAVEPELLLEGEGAFELGAGVDPEVRVVLSPEEWLEVLDEEELEDDGGLIRIDPAHNRQAYAALVERIEQTTEVHFPGEEEEPRDDSR